MSLRPRLSREKQSRYQQGLLSPACHSREGGNPVYFFLILTHQNNAQTQLVRGAGSLPEFLFFYSQPTFLCTPL